MSLRLLRTLDDPPSSPITIYCGKRLVGIPTFCADRSQESREFLHVTCADMPHSLIGSGGAKAVNSKGDCLSHVASSPHPEMDVSTWPTKLTGMMPRLGMAIAQLGLLISPHLFRMENQFFLKVRL